MAKKIVSRGSIVLIRYPFSDLSAIKVRPALILTPNNLLARIDDVLCLFISSVHIDNMLPTDLVIDSAHPSFKSTGLKKRSTFRTHKLALLHKALVLRAIGKADGKLMEQLEERIKIAIGLD